MRRLRRYYERCPERPYATHFLELLKEQLVSVVPIALLIILFVAIFLQRWQPSTAAAFGGLLLVVIGLVLFLEGLRVYFTTFGEKIGEHLPAAQPTWVVLLVAGILGIFVTYAEPATASLVPLGSLVNANAAPYVFIMLNRFRELTVAGIALGVGVAAVVGTLRFLRRWPIRWVVTLSALPCLLISCWMMWGTQDLRINIGLAWDCGAITGGPVTVPILFSMGVGVTKVHGEESVGGCGIITLASLFPILFVQLISLLVASIYTPGDISGERPAGESLIEKLPLQPLISGLRSIIPLAIVLYLVWRFLVKRPLPTVSWLPTEPKEGEEAPPEVAAPSDTGLTWASTKIYLFGFICAQIGIIVFNFGLSYGLVIQGANAGSILPATYTHISTYWPSPRYSKSGGIFLCVMFGFLIGFLATLAEPALHIMGLKVQQITDGQISTRSLKYTIAVGVGLGTALGVIRVIYQIPIFYLILPTYGVALVMSFIGPDDIVALAWDSAGVTTGEVTVPFLLSLGLNFALANKTADGFGLLTCASIGPVLSALSLYFFKAWRRKREATSQEIELDAAPRASSDVQEGADADPRTSA